MPLGRHSASWHLVLAWCCMSVCVVFNAWPTREIFRVWTNTDLPGPKNCLSRQTKCLFFASGQETVPHVPVLTVSLCYNTVILVAQTQLPELKNMDKGLSFKSLSVCLCVFVRHYLRGHIFCDVITETASDGAEVTLFADPHASVSMRRNKMDPKTELRVSPHCTTQTRRSLQHLRPVSNHLKTPKKLNK